MSAHRGSILLLTVFTFLVFTVITTASVRFINRQFRSTVNTESEDRAFRLADDGLDYAVFLLGSGAKTVSDLVNGEQPFEQTVVDPFTEDEAGTFSLTFNSVEGTSTEAVRVRSVGRSALNASLCFTNMGDIARSAETNLWSLTSWESTSGC